MSRLKACLAELKAKQSKAVIPYIVAGDPWPEATVSLMHSLVEKGADVIELGIPFSDPMAEGPVIQLAHERALVHKVGLKNVLAMVAEFRQKDIETPVVLMGYANPVEAMGYDMFASMAEKSGVDAVLIVDIPPEEAMLLHDVLESKSIDTIFLIAPTTSEERIRSICENASGYIYYVSLKGVTGAGHLDTDEVQSKLAQITAYTDLPVCVGFGIKDETSARAIASYADGIVVGSVLVNAIHEASQATEQQNPDSQQVLINRVHGVFENICEGAKKPD